MEADQRGENITGCRVPARCILYCVARSPTHVSLVSRTRVGTQGVATGSRLDDRHGYNLW